MNTTAILKSADSDIYSKNSKKDLHLYNTVKQVCELTACSPDVAATVLFDCNYDIERVVDKIFENQKQSVKESDYVDNAWKEVAKPKKKLNVPEVASNEINVNAKEVLDNKHKSYRGHGRGKMRNARTSVRVIDNANELESGHKVHKRSQGSRLNTNKSRSKTSHIEEVDPNIETEVDNFMFEDTDYPTSAVNEWLSDEGEPDKTDFVTQKESSSVHLSSNPVDIAIKDSKKNGVFGDFSKTKAPAPSNIIPTEAVKLVTSTGVKSSPSRMAFNFGLNFSEYCQTVDEFRSHRVNIEAVTDTLKEIHIEPSELSHVQQISDESRNVLSDDSHSRRVVGYENVSGQLKGDGGFKRGHISEEQSIHRPQINRESNVSFASSLPIHKLSDTSNLADNIFPSSVSAAPQVFPPPGISNAHLLQQLPNHPNFKYLSMMDLSNNQSMFPLMPSNSENPSNHRTIDNNKDFYSKAQTYTKASEHPTTSVLNTMQMPNICCYPPMYMNNYGNFLSAAPQSGHSSAGQQIDSQSQNKSMYSLSSHGNYSNDEYSQSMKHKYGRGEPSYCAKEDDGKGQQGGRSSIGGRAPLPPQPLPGNDPRYLAYHSQHPARQYQGGMYNCVPTTGSHPSGPPPQQQHHQYPMSHQQAPPSLAQLHLMQQQMHNFPQSYQFQEHLMTSMAPNSGSRNSSGSGGSQSRGGRQNNVLWHPSNQ